MRALARLTYLRAGRVLAVAAVVLAGAAFLASGVFDRVDPFDISDPNSEVVAASERIEAVTGRTAEPEVVLLVSASGVDPATAAEAAAATLGSTPGIAAVTMVGSDPRLLSTDGTRSLVLGFLEEGAIRVDVGEAVERAFAGDPEVLPGGVAVAAHQVGLRSENDTRELELYATPVLLLLLLLVFRTVVAALLPLAVAALSILVTLAVLRLLTEVVVIDLFALQTVTGLGVGLAIDYSLFILARYRQEVAEHGSYYLAHRRVLETAGRTVAFSSLTVAAAIAALIAFPQPFLSSTGIAGALTAIVAGATALLALPAALVILGPRVERLGVPKRRPSTARPATDGWTRLARLVCRRPVPAILGGAIAMLVLSSQALGMDVTTPDAGELPADESARVVADSADAFPGVPSTRLFAVLPGGAETPGLRSSLEEVGDVASVEGPRPLDGDSRQLYVTSSVDPLSEEGQALVEEVRDRLPDGALLGGRAAELVDQRASILDRAPLVIAIVVLTTLLLLAALTRSLLLPFIAIAMNLLTVAASLGALVLAFTTEWGASLLGTEVQQGIDLSVPVIAFAVGFGLSTDYGIFLFDRIREERAARRNETGAIVAGVAATGRLITASAALLSVAVGAFVFSDLVIVKEFAVAIAVAVLLDATLVRALLIPAALRLLGGRAWWPGTEPASWHPSSQSDGSRS